MEYIEHIIRKRYLSGDAIIALTSGTESDLYKLENLVSGRPGVPFRSDDSSLIIDIDVGALNWRSGSIPTIREVWLLATNLNQDGSKPSPDYVNLKADNVFPPVAFDQDISFELNDDVISAALILNNGKWAINQPYRYYRLTIKQDYRIDPFSQIGQIWFETNEAGLWPHGNISIEKIDGHSFYNDAILKSGSAKFRSGEIGIAHDVTLADQNFQAMIEYFRNGTLIRSFGGLSPYFFLQVPAEEVSGEEIYQDRWRVGGELRGGVTRTIKGDGKV